MPLEIKNKEEEDVNEQNPPATGGDDEKNNELLTKITEIQEKMVDKEEYIKLENENKQLQKTIVELLQAKPKEEKKSSKELAEEMQKITSEPGHTSLEYVKHALLYREAVLEETNNEIDVFDTLSPEGRNPDIAKGVANALQLCVEQAGDSQSVFEGLLKDAMKHYQDPIIKKK